MAYQVRFPDDFDDYAWEVESKGVFWEAVVYNEGRSFAVTFYDKERLAQDLAEDVGPGRSAVLSRVIVVEHVTRECMSQAVGKLSPGVLD
ncbi:hypothetical protein AB1046_00485 [Promicromonospora sp. Populi]|uniref:hypothetical protein n=1 Tax=Promicromonospora sp. Populi TaxID=3239420 RepID=UPI0034E1DE13